MYKLLLLLLTTAAMSGEWSERPIEPRARPTNTAFTIGARHWQVGLVNQDYGLLDNLQIGTTGPLWFLVVPNGHVKLTAIQTKKLDFALDGGIYWSDLQRLGIPGGQITVTPVGGMASWIVTKNLSLHGGMGWIIAQASGKLTAPQIAQGLQQVTGANIEKELVGALGDGGGLFAGANLTLYQTRLSADWRFNRRDSLILTSNNFVWLNGLVAAGVAVEDIGQGADAADLEVGGSARLHLPLTKSVPATTTLSWQFDWRRFNLRLGVPLQFSNVFAYFQAVDMYWILGPDRRKTPAPPPKDTGTDDDTGETHDTGTSSREQPPDVEETEEESESKTNDTGTDDTGE